MADAAGDDEDMPESVQVANLLIQTQDDRS